MSYHLQDIQLFLNVTSPEHKNGANHEVVLCAAVNMEVHFCCRSSPHFYQTLQMISEDQCTTRHCSLRDFRLAPRSAREQRSFRLIPGCTETPVRNYHYLLRNNPAQRRCHYYLICSTFHKSTRHITFI
jgi:hypothetical protein